MRFLNIILLAEENDAFSWAFVVQLLATAILVFILAKFLVKPVRNYLKSRQDYIQGNIDEANNKNTEADNKLSMANKQLKDAKTTSKEMIENAKVVALNEKDKILNETQQEVTLMKDKALKDIENEKIKMQEQISNEIIDVALLAANKVIGREVNKDDNTKIIEDFIEDQK